MMHTQEIRVRRVTQVHLDYQVPQENVAADVE